MSDDHAIQVAGSPVPIDEARSRILDYCQAVESLDWSLPKGGVGSPPGDAAVPLFAYRTYDCVPGGDTHVIEPIDILVANGLNAEMHVSEMAAVLAVGGELSDQIAEIDERKLCFWELDAKQVATMPADDEPAWPMWRAWTLLMGVKGIKVAGAHKILHHKRPAVFPLLDGPTSRELGGVSAWATLHTDLTATPDGWEQLEVLVSAELNGPADVHLTRLRLHDILVWRAVTGR